MIVNQILQIGNITIAKRKNPNQGRVYCVKGVCPTLSKMSGGSRQPHILLRRKIDEQENSLPG